MATYRFQIFHDHDIIYMIWYAQYDDMICIIWYDMSYDNYIIREHYIIFHHHRLSFVNEMSKSIRYPEILVAITDLALWPNNHRHVHTAVGKRITNFEFGSRRALYVKMIFVSNAWSLRSIFWNTLWFFFPRSGRSFCIVFHMLSKLYIL